ncbi:MAG TPA: hypothetical protein VGF57_03905 [Roseiarcus sp.]
MFFLSAAASAQQINIHLEFDQELDQVSPTQQLVTQLIQVNATLSPGGQMNATSDVSVSGQAHHGKSRRVMHDEGQLRLGGRSENEWKVAGKDKLINIVDLGSFKRAILLTINGSTCSADVDFQLKPGFTDYEFKRGNGRIGVARSVAARRLSCSVGPSTG